MQEIRALKDINFEIKRGAAVSIIGRNGGGKSTLLEILTGTLTPTTGEVKVNGRVSALLELGSGFNPEYSGRDNVILNGLLLGLSKDDILSRFAEIEAFAEIGDAIDRPVKTYSSGMMMRLAFAVQVLCDPDILIIDEALSVGDFFFQQKCMSYIRELCVKGVTLLFVSHDMGAVRDICMRALYLKKGHIKYDGECLEAITQFLTEDANSAREKEIVPQQETKLLRGNPSEALWQLSAPAAGKIHSVYLKDTLGNTSTKFKVGDRAIISIYFYPDPYAPNHITVGFTNRYGQLVTATGSMQLENTPVIFQLPGELQCYELVIDLMMESGNYAFDVTLGYKTAVNRGNRFDKTPPLGPITLTWDFEKNWAPFIGPVGLPSRGDFVVKKILKING
jgi:lipopolysaccharide transport system ATP-binding protein